MRPRKPIVGLVGVLGICITSGALPVVNVLKVFTPGQLMMFRGLVTAFVAFILLVGWKINKVDRYTWLVAMVLPFCTLGLYQGIRHWGAGPTIVVITATPVVNLLVSWSSGRRIAFISVVGFLLVILGVLLAVGLGKFSWAGFGWSTFGMIMNGVLYELLAKAKSGKLEKCLFVSLGLSLLGLVISVYDNSWAQMFQSLNRPGIMLQVVGFGIVGGFLYWFSNVLTFDNLEVFEGSALAQLEAPAVIIAAYFILGEQFSALQWVGLTLTFVGGCLVLRAVTDKTVTSHGKRQICHCCDEPLTS